MASFTEHELGMQMFDDMREEEFLRAWDYIYAAITEAMDRAREEFEHEDMTPYIPEVIPGTLDALDRLSVREGE